MISKEEQEAAKKRVAVKRAVRRCLMGMENVHYSPEMMKDNMKFNTSIPVEGIDALVKILTVLTFEQLKDLHLCLKNFSRGLPPYPRGPKLFCDRCGKEEK